MRLPVLLLAVLMLCLSSAVASTSTDERVPAARTEHTDGSLKLTVVDVSPRFLDFYAVAREADADARWALWDRRYGFAAVPPSPVLEASDPTPCSGSPWAKARPAPSARPTLRAGLSSMSCCDRGARCRNSPACARKTCPHWCAARSHRSAPVGNRARGCMHPCLAGAGTRGSPRSLKVGSRSRSGPHMSCLRA